MKIVMIVTQFRGKGSCSAMEVQQYGGKPYDPLYDRLVRLEASFVGKEKILYRRTDAQLARNDARIAQTDAQLARMDTRLARADVELMDLARRVEALERCYFYQPNLVFRGYFRKSQAPKRCKASRSYRRKRRNKRLGRW